MEIPFDINLTGETAQPLGQVGTHQEPPHQHPTAGVTLEHITLGFERKTVWEPIAVGLQSKR